MMKLNRIVLPILFVGAAVAGAIGTGCNNNTGIAPSPSPVPTCSTCTPVPTATPTGPSPTPSPVPSAYQPLANNDQWNYACNAGQTAEKLVTTGPIVGGTQTFADTLSGSFLTTSVVADEAMDGLGNVSVYQWVYGNSMTTLSSPGLEFSINLSNGPTTYDGPVTGTITTTIAATGLSKNGYTNVVEFKSVNSSPIVPALGEIDTYAALGSGPIELDFPDNGTPLQCPINGSPILFSKVRQH